MRGLRANSSMRSHAELDNSPDLDTGDPVDLGRRYASLRGALGTRFNILGGCCGTDHRHVAAIARGVFAVSKAAHAMLADPGVLRPRMTRAKQKARLESRAFKLTDFRCRPNDRAEIDYRTFRFSADSRPRLDTISYSICWPSFRSGQACPLHGGNVHEHILAAAAAG